MRRYRNIAHKNLIYLDPPYYVKGRELYVNFFKDADHIALSQAVQQRDNLNWIITYDNHSFIHNLYINANRCHMLYHIVPEQINMEQSYFFASRI